MVLRIKTILNSKTPKIYKYARENVLLPYNCVSHNNYKNMNKKELIKRLSGLPDSLDVEVAIKGRNNDGKYLRRIIMDVQCRHDNKKGKDIISLICLKSLKEEYELINEASKGIKNI